MASVVVYIKKDYLDKNGESNVIMQYDHLYKRWRFNTGLKANPEKIDCAYDEDTIGSFSSALVMCSLLLSRLVGQGMATLSDLLIR